MKKKEPEKSDVIDLLDLVWSSANDSTGFSWERLNCAMHRALKLTIDSGFRFAENDLRYVGEHYSSGRWLGASIEWIYAAAIAVENDSAIKAFEVWKNREPIIADNVDCYSRLSEGTHGQSLIRAKCRLFVGATFIWKGVRVEVTSFAGDSSYCTACSYKKPPKGSYANKVDKRFKITRDDIIADRAERKKSAKVGA